LPNALLTFLKNNGILGQTTILNEFIRISICTDDTGTKESSQHGRPQKFFQGGNVVIFLILFRLLTMQCKLTFAKRFTVSAAQRKCLMLQQRNSHKKCTSLSAMLHSTDVSFHTV